MSINWLTVTVGTTRTTELNQKIVIKETNKKHAANRYDSELASLEEEERQAVQYG